MVIDCIQQYLIHQLRVVKSNWLPAKIAAYLVSISWLLCLAFLYAWTFKIKYPWTGHLLRQLSHLLQNFLTMLPAGSCILSLDMLQNEFRRVVGRFCKGGTYFIFQKQ